MKWRSMLATVAVFLAMSGSMLGSDPEERLQVRWSELKKLIRGKMVVVQLSDGARVEGRVHRVKEPSIVLWVKRSTEYPKGKSEIAREAVSRIEARDLNVNLAARRAKKAALTVGAAVGALVGSVVLFLIAGPDEGSGAPALWGGIALGSAVAVLMNLPQRSKDVTLIELLPDSPSGGEPKPTNKDSTPRPKQNSCSLEEGNSSKGFESVWLDSNPRRLWHHRVVVPLLVKGSDQAGLHRQARRALMRPEPSTP